MVISNNEKVTMVARGAIDVDRNASKCTAKKLGKFPDKCAGHLEYDANSRQYKPEQLQYKGC